MTKPQKPFRFLSAFLLAALFTGSAISESHAATRAVRVIVTSEFDAGRAFFDVIVDDNHDLLGIIYTSPTEPAPIRMSYQQVIRPTGQRAGHGGAIVTWKSERPAFIIVANENTFDRRHGGEISIKYLHNGRYKSSPQFRSLPMRLVREGDSWKVLTDNHARQIRSICFRQKKFLAWVVGAERHEINVSCPKQD